MGLPRRGCSYSLLRLDGIPTIKNLNFSFTCFPWVEFYITQEIIVNQEPNRLGKVRNSYPNFRREELFALCQSLWTVELW